jgi:hypothetical protein
LYGGFKGDEDFKFQRDPAANDTVLSGDIGAVDDNSDNSYHVVTGSNNTVLDGFTVTKGRTVDVVGVSTAEKGAGLYAKDISMTISNCLFTKNASDINAGGIWAENSTMQIEDSKFIDNTAVNGAGIEFYNCSDSTVVNCWFEDNIASNNGGGLYTNQASPDVYNTVFLNNSANYGGGVFNYDYSSPSFINCLFTKNNEVMESRDYCQVSVTNSIVWDNGSLFEDQNSSVTTVTYSNVTMENPDNVYNDDSTNINETPIFVEADQNNFRLQTGSPGIDAGNNAVVDAISTDMDGNDRIKNSIVDMGPYEN